MDNYSTLPSPTFTSTGMSHEILKHAYVVHIEITLYGMCVYLNRKKKKGARAVLHCINISNQVMLSKAVDRRMYSLRTSPYACAEIRTLRSQAL